MEVELHPEMQRYVEEKVKRGDYPSVHELINGALRELRSREELEESPEYREYLRREVAKGMEQIRRGEVSPWNVEEIKTEGRRLLAERRKTKGG